LIIFGEFIDLIYIGFVAAVIAWVMIAVSITFGLMEAAWVFKRWWFLLTWQRHLDDVETAAWAIHETREDVETLYRKIHYRHNIHCPACGRFAKRVPNLPEGVSDCKVHGVRMRTIEYTGMIDVEIRMVQMLELPPEPPAVTNAYELPEIVVDFTDDDYVLDEGGLPVFTQPLAIEEFEIDLAPVLAIEEGR